MNLLDAQSLILIALGVLIPLALILKNNPTIIVIYFCATLHLDILSFARNEVNFTFLKFFSIVSIPFTLLNIYRNRKSLARSDVFKGIFVFYIFVLFSCIFFGIIQPWADTSGVRSTFDSSMFKSFRQLVTVTGELSLGILMAQNIKIVGLEKTLKYLLAVTSICVIGIVLERTILFDFYHFITQGKPFLDPFRARGFNYEPRGLSNTMAIACLYAFFHLKRNWLFLIFSVAFLAGNFAAISMVGNTLMMITFIIMLTIAIYQYYQFSNKDLFKKVIIFASCLTLHFAIPWYFESFTSNEYFKKRMAYQRQHFKDRSYAIGGSTDLIQKLEVHDAAAMAFLKVNPIYAISGVGLGTMGIASSPYILPRDKAVWGNRSDNNPHMGGVLLLSQYGLIGSLCLLFILIVSLKQLPIKHSLLALGLLCIWILQLRYGIVLIYAILLHPVVSQQKTAKLPPT